MKIEYLTLNDEGVELTYFLVYVRSMTAILNDRYNQKFDICNS